MSNWKEISKEELVKIEGGDTKKLLPFLDWIASIIRK